MKISINDKELGLSWGMGAIEIYCDTLGCDIEGLNDVTLPYLPDGKPNPNHYKALVNIILAALRNYSEIHDEPFDMTYRKLQAWLDEAPQETFSQIMDDFAKSKFLGKTISEYLIGEIPDQDTLAKKKD